jgi:hypothetical protein
MNMHVEIDVYLVGNFRLGVNWFVSMNMFVLEIFGV